MAPINRLFLFTKENNKKYSPDMSFIRCRNIFVIFCILFVITTLAN